MESLPTTLIERVDIGALTEAEFLREYVAKSRPVVIENALAGWKPLKWTPGTLVEAAGGASTFVTVAPLQARNGFRHAWIEPAKAWPIAGPAVSESSLIESVSPPSSSLTSPPPPPPLSPLSSTSIRRHLRQLGVRRPEIVLALSSKRVSVPVGDFASAVRGVSSDTDMTYCSGGGGSTSNGSTNNGSDDDAVLTAAYADGGGNVHGDESFSFLRQDLEPPPKCLFCTRDDARERELSREGTNSPAGLANRLLPRRTGVWIGRNSISSLHFDNYENLFAQVVNRKRFLLMAPKWAEILVKGRLRKVEYEYDCDAFRQKCEKGKAKEVGQRLLRRHRVGDTMTSAPLEGACFRRHCAAVQNIEDANIATSSLNYAAFSFEKPPIALRSVMNRIPIIDATLEEGDLLYLPALWWHEVTALPDVPGPNARGCWGISHQFEPFYARKNSTRKNIRKKENTEDGNETTVNSEGSGTAVSASLSSKRASAHLGSIVLNPAYRHLHSEIFQANRSNNEAVEDPASIAETWSCKEHQSATMEAASSSNSDTDTDSESSFDQEEEDH